MKSFRYHYNFALNGSKCDDFLDFTSLNSSLKAPILPVYFHMDGLYPIDCAVPIYGFIVPCLALMVVIINILIIVIFSKPHIRSHTTVILTIIALADSLNISLPSTIYVYYYVLGNHKDYVPYQLCQATFLLIHLLPEMFNLISVWSTILLACIRFRCLQSPFKAKSLHTNRRIAVGITFAVSLAILVQVPSLALFDFLPVNVTSTVTNRTMTTCVVATSKLINGACILREIHIWIELFVNSFIPCFMLILLDLAILYTLHKAERRRGSLNRRGSSFKVKVKRKSFDKRHICKENGCDQRSGHTALNYSNLRQTDSNDTMPDRGENIQKTTQVSLKDRSNDLMDKNVISEYGVNKGNSSVEKCAHYSDSDSLSSNKCVSRNSLQQRFQNRLSSVLHFTGHGLNQLGCDSPINSKDFKTSSTRSNDSYKRLAKESRRTSWMIFAVVALICSHELLYGILFAHKMVTNVGPVPINFFGCGTVYLYLWQYITYPLIFLIYCFMSSAFRIELRNTLTCRKAKPGKRQTHGRNSVFMSPCTLRKSMSRSQGEKECNEKLVEK